eukprot:Transcript_5867.p1 GENE.Transcript_5867~~Transcript_5867.p1  ORF type:complete len:262 (-),score=71.58 Transcript_5867:22-807(-)
MAAAPAATEAGQTSPWSAEGKAMRQASAAAATAAAELQALVTAERQAAASDAGSERRVASREAQRIATHLQSARSCLAQLGAAAPVCRSAGFTTAALLAAGLAADRDGGLGEHRERWGAMSESCDAAFDAARDALDAGVTSLSLGGALSDVETSIAMREAQTSQALLLEWADGAAAAAAAASSVIDGDGDGDGGAWLDEARASLELVEPGHRAALGDVQFVRGHGELDHEARRDVRRRAAESYIAASRTDYERGCQYTRSR